MLQASFSPGTVGGGDPEGDRVSPSEYVGPPPGGSDPGCRPHTVIEPRPNPKPSTPERGSGQVPAKWINAGQRGFRECRKTAEIAVVQGIPRPPKKLHRQMSETAP
ncbi:hypothetical protein GCM10027456_80520 [Kineosporia babensis]